MKPIDYIVILAILILILLVAYFIYKKYLAIREKKPKKVIWYKCLDGHKVRSLGELVIDNALYLMNVPHEYEDYINKFKSKFKYDWYLPQNQLYIEYFGYWTEAYKKRRKQKVKFYQKERLALLEIDPEDLENIVLFLEINLKRYNIDTHKISPMNEIKDTSFQQSEIKHCHNCGARMDDRF